MSLIYVDHTVSFYMGPNTLTNGSHNVAVEVFASCVRKELNIASDSYFRDMYNRWFTDTLSAIHT